MSSQENNDEGPVCRMCHCEGEPNRPLFYPCKCSGSIRYVHQDCLMQWLKVKSRHPSESKCELCGESYKFKNIYATGDSPPRLSIWEFFQAVVPLIRMSIIFLCRLCNLVFLWIIGLPIMTSIVNDYYSALLRNKEPILIMPLFDSPSTVLSSWWRGIGYLTFILFFSFGATQLATFLYIEYRKLRLEAISQRLHTLQRRLRELEAAGTPILAPPPPVAPIRPVIVPIQVPVVPIQPMTQNAHVSQGQQTTVLPMTSSSLSIEQQSDNITIKNEGRRNIGEMGEISQIESQKIYDRLNTDLYTADTITYQHNNDKEITKNLHSSTNLIYDDTVVNPSVELLSTINNSNNNNNNDNTVINQTRMTSTSSSPLIPHRRLSELSETSTYTTRTEDMLMMIENDDSVWRDSGKEFHYHSLTPRGNKILRKQYPFNNNDYQDNVNTSYENLSVSQIKLIECENIDDINNNDNNISQLSDDFRYYDHHTPKYQISTTSPAFRQSHLDTISSQNDVSYIENQTNNGESMNDKYSSLNNKEQNTLKSNVSLYERREELEFNTIETLKPSTAELLQPTTTNHNNNDNNTEILAPVHGPHAPSPDEIIQAAGLAADRLNQLLHIIDPIVHNNEPGRLHEALMQLGQQQQQQQPPHIPNPRPIAHVPQQLQRQQQHQQQQPLLIPNQQQHQPLFHEVDIPIIGHFFDMNNQQQQQQQQLPPQVHDDDDLHQPQLQVPLNDLDQDNRNLFQMLQPPLLLQQQQQQNHGLGIAQPLQDVFGRDFLRERAAWNFSYENWIYTILFIGFFLLIFQVIPVLSGRLVIQYFQLNTLIMPYFTAILNNNNTSDLVYMNITSILQDHMKAISDNNITQGNTALQRYILEHIQFHAQMHEIDDIYENGMLMMYMEEMIGYMVYTTLLGTIGTVMVLRYMNLDLISRLWVLVWNQIKYTFKVALSSLKACILFYMELILPAKVLGLLFALCTIKTFQTTFEDRFEICSIYPLFCAFSMWVIGSAFMFHFSLILQSCRQCLKDDIANIWFPGNRDLDAFVENILGFYENRPFLEHLYRIVLNFGYYIILFILIIFIPLQYGHYLFPVISSSPLRFRFSKTVSDIEKSVELLVSHLLLPLLVERSQGDFVDKLIRGICYKNGQLLNLGLYLNPFVFTFAREEQDREMERIRQIQLKERVKYMNILKNATNTTTEVQADTTLQSTINESNITNNATTSSSLSSSEINTNDTIAAEGEIHVDTTTSSSYNSMNIWEFGRYTIEIRTIMMYVFSSLTLSIVYACALHIPLALGRNIVYLVSGNAEHDIYSMCIGVSICWGGSQLASYIIRDLHGNNAIFSFLSIGCKWIFIGLKALFVSSISLTILPLLIGILNDALFLNPLTVSWNETPHYPVFRCWALGIIFLKGWIKFSLMGFFGDTIWRRKWQRVVDQGFLHLNPIYVIFDIIIPLICICLDYLLIPYCMSRILCLYVHSYYYQTLITRYSFVIYFLSIKCSELCLLLLNYLSTLHNQIRDARYLIGTELTNR